MTVAIAALVLAFGASSQSEKPAVPSEESQARSEKTIREIFKSEYSAKPGPALQKLAKTLLEQGAQTEDEPSLRYVLFREAALLAGKSGDVATLLRAAGELCAGYRVDGPALKESLFLKADLGLLGPEDAARLAEADLLLAREAVEHEELDVAARAAQASAAAAKKAKDVGLAGRADAFARGVGEIRAASERSKAAGSVLAQTPEDPAANQARGEYLCLVLGRWDEGLPFLGKGADAVLRALALKELGDGRPAAAAADGWWEFAESEKSPIRKQSALDHACALYRALLPEASGLSKIRMEKRLSQAGLRPAGAPGRPSVDLLKAIDPGKDTLKGSWQAAGNGHLRSTAGQALLQIPYLPPEEYELKVVVVPEPEAEVNLGLVFEKKHFDVAVDGWKGTCSGIDLIDGAMANANETTRKGQFLASGMPNTILVSVRKSLITVTVNGVPLFQWKPEAKRLEVHPLWSRPKNGTLSVGGWVPFTITGLELTPLSGDGKGTR